MRDLTKGLPAAEAWRFVEASDPALIEAWDKARADFDRHESGYQARAADWQRRVGERRAFAKRLGLGIGGRQALGETVVSCGHLTPFLFS